jgi:hypothetical protein
MASIVGRKQSKGAKIHREYNRQTGDAVASLVKNNEEASTKLAAQLYDGRISWGQYNNGRIEIGLQMEQEAKNLLH